MLGWKRSVNSPCLPLTRIAPSLTLTSTPSGTVTGFFPIRDMVSPDSYDRSPLVTGDATIRMPSRRSPHLAFTTPCLHQTLQRTSPPTFWLRASRFESIPLLVERMQMPIPWSTRGTLSTPQYTRQPGLLVRSRCWITRSPLGPYLRLIRSVG